MIDPTIQSLAKGYQRLEAEHIKALARISELNTFIKDEGLWEKARHSALFSDREIDEMTRPQPEEVDAIIARAAKKAAKPQSTVTDEEARAMFSQMLKGSARGAS